MDFYLLLGVPREASTAQIKRAYTRLARKHHPGINPGDARAAQHYARIADAYATLMDPERRRRYDRGGAPPAVVSPAAAGFQGFDFSQTVSGEEAPTFGDLFADVLQARAAAPLKAAAPGADVHADLALTFEQALGGGAFPLTITRTVACAACDGSGVRAQRATPCRACDGVGALATARGHMVFTKPCVTCGGTGQQPAAACPGCGGRGVGVRTEALTVTVPGGVADGEVLRLRGGGHAGHNGGASGALCVTVRVAPHPWFRREGQDLHLTVPVAIHEAALGARVTIPSPDGPIQMKIPPGTQGGQRFRLRDRGARSPVDGRRGDLLVTIQLMLPDVLDERSKTLLREFGQIHPEDIRRWRTDDAGTRTRALHD